MSGPGGAGAARRPPPRGMGGGPFGGPGLPAEKPKNLKASFGRLVGQLRPEAPRIILVIALAILSVTCAVVGPKILGNATDIIFDERKNSDRPEPARAAIGEAPVVEHQNIDTGKLRQLGRRSRSARASVSS